MKRYERKGLIFYKTTSPNDVMKLVNLYKGDHQRTLLLVATYKSKKNLNILWWNIATTYPDRAAERIGRFYIGKCKTWNTIVNYVARFFMPSFANKMDDLTLCIQDDVYKELMRQ